MKRTSKTDWRSRSAQLSQKYTPHAELTAARKFKLFTVPPWENILNANVYDHVPGITGKNDPVSVILEASIAQIASLNAAPTLYTDGSASGGTLDGGAAVVVTTGP